MSREAPAGGLLRGIALIVVAIVLGVVLLNATDDEPVGIAAGDDDNGTELGGEPGGGDDETTPTTAAAVARDPAQVTILVANGSGVRGAAGRVADTLKGSNYVTVEPTNTKTPAEASVVYFTPGYEADATAIANLLTPVPGVSALPAELPIDDLAAANILVVVAADLAGAG